MAPDLIHIHRGQFMADVEDIIVRSATSTDAGHFPTIERSAGMRFEEIAELAWIAQEKDRSLDEYRHLVQQGLSWSALSPSGHPVGFLCSTIEDGDLHVWELAVYRDWQGCGIGRALVESAVRCARRRNISALTMTTFKNVPWNAALYANWGFSILGEGTISPRLQSLLNDEVKRGLPRHHRCAMRLDVAAGKEENGLPCPQTEFSSATEKC